MKKNWPLLLLSLCLTALPSLAQDTLSARQIIEKNIMAQGGRYALAKMRTVYTEFQTTMEGHEVHYVIKEMLPNKGSFEIVYQGRTVFDRDGDKPDNGGRRGLWDLLIRWGYDLSRTDR